MPYSILPSKLVLHGLNDLDTNNLLFRNSIHGSAVCAFTMADVHKSFDGPFKYQESDNRIWEKVEGNVADKSNFQCGAASSNVTQHSYKSMRNKLMYQLMDQPVQHSHGKPFMFSTKEYYKFIAVDIIKTKHYDSVEVFFIGTRDGKLLKYVKWPHLDEACLFDTIQLVNSSDRLLSMKYLKDTQSLYFGTEKQVIRMLVHRCHVHHTREECVSSGDPYCGWNKDRLKCVKAPGNNHASEHWTQPKVPKCSQMIWSHWFKCQKDNIKGSGQSCQCRKRACNTHSEACVDNVEIQVANCTTHGGWSPWSSWSSCSPSCHKGTQYRVRTCTNPVPSPDGKQCEGDSEEVSSCSSIH